MEVGRQSNKFVTLAISRNEKMSRKDTMKVALIYAKRKRGTTPEVIKELTDRVKLEEEIEKIAF